jgi:hypothetical protein
MDDLAGTVRKFGSSPGMTAAGTVLSAGSQIGSGIAARRAGQFAGAQGDMAAGQAEAASQRTAADVTRRSNILQSKALANAAASGGGASDPTVTDVVSRIAGEGAYRSQLALYEGSDTARALRQRADVARYQGTLAERAGYIGAAGSALRGGATLLDKPPTLLDKGTTLYDKYKGDVGGVEPYFDPSTWGMS